MHLAAPGALEQVWIRLETDSTWLPNLEHPVGRGRRGFWKARPKLIVPVTQVIGYSLEESTCIHLDVRIELHRRHTAEAICRVIEHSPRHVLKQHLSARACKRPSHWVFAGSRE